MKEKSIKKPYLTSELFNIITEKAIASTISNVSIEHTSAYRETHSITYYEFDIVTEITRGIEGLYLSVFLNGDAAEDTRERIYIGHIKTLNDSLDAYRNLGILAGEICYYGMEFIESNLDDFTWRGFRIEYDKSKLEVLSPNRALTLLNEHKTAHVFDLSKWNNPEVTENALLKMSEANEK